MTERRSLCCCVADTGLPHCTCPSAFTISRIAGDIRSEWSDAQWRARQVGSGGHVPFEIPTGARVPRDVLQAGLADYEDCATD